MDEVVQAIRWFAGLFGLFGAVVGSYHSWRFAPSNRRYLVALPISILAFGFVLLPIIFVILTRLVSISESLQLAFIYIITVATPLVAGSVGVWLARKYPQP